MEPSTIGNFYIEKLQIKNNNIKIVAGTFFAGGLIFND